MNKAAKEPSAWTSRVVRWMWLCFGGFVAFCVVMFFLLYNGIVGYMPPIEELKNPSDRFASMIFSSDGVEMGRFYQSKGNRVYVDFDEMSPYLTQALIATEDVRFDSHSGIDARAILRALIMRGVLQRKNAGGGSTITQQLAKQLYSPQSSNIIARAIQKPVEWVIALKLERYYTKDEIIKMYFNQFDFLYNAVGIKSAAFVYFGKEPKDLNVEESAMLVGMLKNPSLYNPLRNPERCLSRRNVVFDQMVKADFITEEEGEALKAKPLVLDFHRIDHKDGIAPYFRMELRRYMTAKEPRLSDYPSWNYQAYVDDSIAWETNPLYGWCEKNRKPDGKKYNVNTDGLKIYTTIDSRMQRYAEAAVLEHLGKDLQKRFLRERGGTHNPYSNNTEELSRPLKAQLLKNAITQSERYRVLKLNGYDDNAIDENFRTKTDMRVFSYDGGIDTVMTPLDSILYVKSFLRTGMMSMDPVTGYVKAYVGGPDYKFFQYDMAGRGRRQIGSTCKPFLYALAMEEDYTPCDEFMNTQPTIEVPGGVWQPRNSGSSHVGEMVTLRWALTNSNNWISARLITADRMSPQQLVRKMHAFGITNHLDAVPSLALGPCDVSVKEMVAAYTAFANKGMRVSPIYVTRITDNQGNVISEFKPTFNEVISEQGYYKILSILLNVVDSGTGARLRRAPFNLTAQLGGKTGTTNYNADGWFMGFTPDLVTGVWVGGEERYIHFNNMASGQGAAMALPIFGYYMKKVFGDRTLPYSQSKTFEFPAELDLCQKEFLGGVPIDQAGGEIEPEEAIDGLFD
ncbi:MAG: transglycosylase domain-containing protein [Muribaculaceae bacterium]